MVRDPGDDLMEPGADLARRVGLRLRQRRTDRGHTLSETAKQASVSVSYLSAIENGNNLPSLPILARLVGALGLSLNELLHDVGESDITGGSIEPSHRGVPRTTMSRETSSGKDFSNSEKKWRSLGRRRNGGLRIGSSGCRR